MEKLSVEDLEGEVEEFTPYLKVVLQQSKAKTVEAEEDDFPY